VKNIYGFSDSYSLETEILAAAVPSQPAAAITSISGVNVVIDWNTPLENGAAITSYIIEILDSTGAWQQDSTYCDGADPTVISSTSCEIPLLTLIDSEDNFKLGVADLVVARITAINVIGQSLVSDSNIDGAYI